MTCGSSCGRGLAETRGRYKALLTLFGMPDTTIDAS
jgi:hypothetical protein